MSESELCPVHNTSHLPYEPSDQCWDGKHTNPNPVPSDSVVRHDSDEEGNPVDRSVGWDLSFGCNLTIGFTGEALAVTVNTSDQDQKDGITHRAVTREQVADYARKLLELVGDPMLTAEERLGDIRHALAGEGFCAPDTDERTALASIRARIQDLVDRAERAEAYPTVDAYEAACAARTKWQERAEKADTDAYDKAQALAALQLAVLDIPVGSGGAACNDDYVRIARDAKNRIEELIGLACDGSSTCRSPLHVDGCFRSEVKPVAIEDSKQKQVRVLADVVEAAGWNRDMPQTLAEYVGSLRERAERAGNPDIRDLAYRTMRKQRDEAIARANNAVAEARDTLLGGDVQVTLHTPGTYEGDAQVVAIGEAIERMRDGADSSDIARAAITVLRGETSRYAEERAEEASNPTIHLEETNG